MLAWSLSLVLLPSTKKKKQQKKTHCEILRVVISGSVVCWKGLCSENTTWSKLRIADRTRRKKKNKNEKKKNATLRSPHFVSVQPHLHHLRVQAWSLFLSLSLSFSKTCWIYFASSPTAWPTERGRLFVHKMAPLTQAWTLKPSPSPSFPPRLAHHQLLAVVDLLIDAATETHWKSPGTGPTTWTYALFFMHVVVPRKKKRKMHPPPPS